MEAWARQAANARRIAMFVIEDDSHAEPQPDGFASFDEAIVELKFLASIPWDEFPHRAPCSNWRDCGRLYVIVEYDDNDRTKILSELAALRVSKDGTKWLLQA